MEYFWYGVFQGDGGVFLAAWNLRKMAGIRVVHVTCSNLCTGSGDLALHMVEVTCSGTDLENKWTVFNIFYLHFTTVDKYRTVTIVDFSNLKDLLWVSGTRLKIYQFLLEEQKVFYDHEEHFSCNLFQIHCMCIIGHYLAVIAWSKMKVTVVQVYFTLPGIKLCLFVQRIPSGQYNTTWHEQRHIKTCMACVFYQVKVDGPLPW